MSILNTVVEKIQKRVFNDFDIYQLIRLVIIVGGYIFLRTRVSDYLKQQQLKAQIEHDKELKSSKLINDPTGEIAKAEDEELFKEHEGINKSEKGWGWGKSTRRKIKKQQAIFEQEIEKAAVEAQRKLQSGYDSDEEINELLHD
ncbi:hypothetical protein C6P40_004463 [Pichia californica]|uniref:Processing of GAS1 and ALP protein 2 n=1 Tax=Pichia californica TaxID=460514 RepID=A0A9P6WMQ3_9ASCO|nr:hypothetical protein C6P42_000664 [[Candida] californica]KAG0689804.1 hypothetical protein C6P40_004463 [[Candida] californica]